MDDIGKKANGLIGFVTSARGAVTLLAAGMVVGMFVTDYRSKQRFAENAKVIASLDRQVGWIICTSVPPNRSDVLSALGRGCGAGSNLPQVELEAIPRYREPSPVDSDSILVPELRE